MVAHCLLHMAVVNSKVHLDPAAQGLGSTCALSMIFSYQANSRVRRCVNLTPATQESQGGVTAVGVGLV